MSDFKVYAKEEERLIGEMSVSVIQVEGTDQFILRGCDLERSWNYILNGEDVPQMHRNDGSIFVVTKDDVLLKKETYERIVRYVRGEEVLSVEEYNEKPQNYDEGSSEEQVLRAIANRKELKGFEPVKETPPPTRLSFRIEAYAKETGSKFINSSISPKMYGKTLYATNGSDIALDEYKILSEKYADHASFQEPKDGYLRFTKVNNSYCFGSGFPFGDAPYRDTFEKLESAQKEELRIREKVREAVERVVFDEEVTEHKASTIVSNLRLINKMKTKKAINEAIDSIIKDLESYVAKGR